MKGKHRLRVLKKKVLGKVFGAKMEEVTEDLRILQFTKCYLDDKIKDRMSKAAHRGKGRGAYRVWWGNLNETDHLEELGVDEKIILKCILNVMEGHGLD
jgi:hypothetical protein